MFKERLTPTTTVKVQQTTVPAIFINQLALIKMKHYVEICDMEVGWLGTAFREGNQILIDDVYLFHQEVHATTTEITVDGLSTFGETIMQQEDGMEVWNNLKVWGHSHVRMGITPSGQDDSQMNAFATGGHGWFIRIICNKLGELKCDLYDFEAGIIYLDLSWKVLPNQAERDLLAQIDELYLKIDALHEMESEHHKFAIVDEMSEKVKKKTYTTYVPPARTGEQKSLNAAPRLNWQQELELENQCYEWENLQGKDEKKIILLPEKHIDLIGEINIDFWKYFTSADLEEIAFCKDTDELESDMWENFNFRHFTQADLRKIHDFAKKRCFAGREL